MKEALSFIASSLTLEYFRKPKDIPKQKELSSRKLFHHEPHTRVLCCPLVVPLQSNIVLLIHLPFSAKGSSFQSGIATHFYCSYTTCLSFRVEIPSPEFDSHKTLAVGEESI